jgi:hypothetical protein
MCSFSGFVEAAQIFRAAFCQATSAVEELQFTVFFQIFVTTLNARYPRLWSEGGLKDEIAKPIEERIVHEYMPNPWGWVTIWVTQSLDRAFYQWIHWSSWLGSESLIAHS